MQSPITKVRNQSHTRIHCKVCQYRHRPCVVSWELDAYPCSSSWCLSCESHKLWTKPQTKQDCWDSCNSATIWTCSPRWSVFLVGLILSYLHHPPHAQPFLQAEVIQFTQRSRRSERTSVVHMGAEMSNKERNSYEDVGLRRILFQSNKL